MSPQSKNVTTELNRVQNNDPWNFGQAAPSFTSESISSIVTSAFEHTLGGTIAVPLHCLYNTPSNSVTLLSRAISYALIMMHSVLKQDHDVY